MKFTGESRDDVSAEAVAVVLVGGNDDLAELLVKAGFARAFGQVVDAPKGKSMADYARMEKTAKAGKMGLYGGNKPKTSESSGSRLGSSPSRLPRQESASNRSRRCWRGCAVR